VVEHFFVTTTHHWILFFTNKGRVYRAKAYELPEAGRDAKGQHVANLLAFQPDEAIAQVLAILRLRRAPTTWCSPPAGAGEEDPLTEYDSAAPGRHHRHQPGATTTS
jgi:DNA gyrase subunit A